MLDGWGQNRTIIGLECCVTYLGKKEAGEIQGIPKECLNWDNSAN